jgi:hypothetical protein
MKENKPESQVNIQEFECKVNMKENPPEWFWHQTMSIMLKGAHYP